MKKKGARSAYLADAAEAPAEEGRQVALLGTEQLEHAVQLVAPGGRGERFWQQKCRNFFLLKIHIWIQKFNSKGFWQGQNNIQIYLGSINTKINTSNIYYIMLILYIIDINQYKQMKTSSLNFELQKYIGKITA